MQLAVLKLDSAGEGRVAQVVQTVDSVLSEAIAASRSLAVELSPPVLHRVGLVGGLKWLANQMKQQSRFEVQVQSDGGPEPAVEEIRLLLFECVRELLFNAMKHSGLPVAAVTVGHTPDSIEITVADSGKGFDPDLVEARSKDAPTFGLFSIQQRLTHLGGSMRIDTAPGRGTRVFLTAPTCDAKRSARGTKEKKQNA
jgi:two-component system CheB/CheR fusion protein